MAHSPVVKQLKYKAFWVLLLGWIPSFTVSLCLNFPLGNGDNIIYLYRFYKLIWISVCDNNNIQWHIFPHANHSSKGIT